MHIKYTQLLQEHIPQCRELMLDSFEKEQLVRYFGISRKELTDYIYFQEFIEVAAGQHLSVAAVDEESGSLVGVNLVEIFRVEETPLNVTRRVIPYFKLFEKLGKELEASMDTTSLLMMDSLAVKRDYRGLGICQGLILQAEKLHKSEFHYSMMYATNEVSQNVAAKCGYREVLSENYCVDVNNNNGLVPVQGKVIKVMVKNLEKTADDR